MNKAVAILFAISCLTTSNTSANILGVGMWFWIIAATGIFVAVSQFLPALRQLGSAAALLLALIAVLAVVLTLLAATIGGSFKLDNREALLVFGFFMIAVTGLLLARVNKRQE
jgi:hypothetical protein